MISFIRFSLRSSLLLGALAMAACAHAPVVSQDAQAATPAGGRQYERKVVTGSRIPQWVDARSGIPATTSPVSIFTYDDVVRTGKSTNLGAALEQLDPTVVGR